MTNELIRLYRQFRKANSSYWCGSYRHHGMFSHDIGDAKRCLDNARTILAFRELAFDDDDEDAEPDPADYENGETIGLVRLRCVPDECHDWQDDRDCWTDNCTTDEQREHALERFEHVSRDGAWGTIGEVWDGSAWQEIDSCWGHVGYDNPADPFENDYVLDHMRSCLDASRKLTADREALELAWTFR